MEIKKNITEIFQTKRNCIKCGRKELIHDTNYAGLNFNKTNFAFPDRIKIPKIPGPKSKVFLCEECINREYKLECKTHGVITGDKYSFGKPPKCSVCEGQLKTISKGLLPDGFEFIVSLTTFRDKNNEIVDDARLCLSKNNELYIISKKVIVSERPENLSFKITHEYNSLSFIIEPHTNKSFSSCNITIRYGYVPNCSGTWIQLWKPEFKHILKLEKTSAVYCLVSFNHQGILKDTFKGFSKKYWPCICSIEKGLIKTFPEIDIKPIDDIHAWELTGAGLNKKLSIIFEKDYLTEQLTIENFNGVDGFQALDQLSQKLPKSLSDFPIKPLDHKGLFNLTFITESQNTKTLLELSNNSIKATTIPDGNQVQFVYYYPFNQSCVLLSNDYKIIARGAFSKESIENISQSAQKVERLLTDAICRHGIFIEKDPPHKVIPIRLFDNGFTIAESENVTYSDIKKIDILNNNNDLFELVIEYAIDSGETASLNVIAPEKYAYNALEAFEVSKVKSTSQNLPLAETYHLYNDLKKYNLLTGLFSNIIIMVRELDHDIKMNEIAERLEYMTSEQLYNDKKLYEQTQKKLLLLNMFLPKIKQNFEYLSSYYPYYQLNNEIDLMAGAFGKNVAQSMAGNERKRIVFSSRNNVRSVQAKFQTIFSEIERAVHPIAQYFSREEVNKSLFSKITKWFPHGAQAAMIGTLFATGASGGVGVIAGMLGIRTLHDILNYFKSDKETASQIKKIFENVIPWWRLLKDTIPVASYESAEAINEDNAYCMQRDHEIYQQFPEEKRAEIDKRLKVELQKKINEGTKNRFSEILEGSSIRFDALISELENAINNEMPQSIREITSTFTLQQLNAPPEDTDG